MTKYEIAEKETMGIFDEHELDITGLSNSMDIYAKQEAIGFLKWAVENHSVPYEGFSLSANRSLGGDTKFVDGKEITITQFYELYLKSKQ